MDEDQYKQALAAYQTQYNNALNYSQNTDKAFSGLYNQQAGYGDSQRLQLASDAARQLAQGQASLMNRGMYGTSAYDAAVRGSNADRNTQMANLQDQLYQRQNSIKQAQLGFEGQANQLLSGIQGQQAGFMGSAQQARQQQDVQMGIAHDQNVVNRENALTGAQSSAASNQAGILGQQIQAANQQQMQLNQFGQQNHMADTYGFAEGGSVPGVGNSDSVPAMLTPGEFVLSKDMIAALEAGKLQAVDILQAIKQQRSNGTGFQQHFRCGGYVHAR